ncbi:MAG: low molecular weight phosphatase family protein, partial [Oscillospiraceae bacterium]
MEHKRTIVFICTGNTCRSPMAKAIFSDKLPERYCDNFEVESAGIMPQEGESAAENSVLALAQIGIDITNHSAQKITKDMLSEAELFVCMSAEHQAVLEKMGVSP